MKLRSNDGKNSKIMLWKTSLLVTGLLINWRVFLIKENDT